MRKPLVSVAPLGVCLLLGACFGGLKNDVPAPVNYRISAPKIAPGAALAADILVSVQATAPGLDGTAIAARFPGSRIDYLAGARWPVRTPALIESALIEALQDSGRLRSVQGDFGRFRTTHTLTLEVRRFEADYTAGEPPVAQVALAVTIGRQSDRSVLAAFTVAAEERASENRISAVVAALDAAFARAATDIATRSLDTIAADLARAADTKSIRGDAEVHARVNSHGRAVPEQGFAPCPKWVVSLSEWRRCCGSPAAAADRPAADRFLS